MDTDKIIEFAPYIIVILLFLWQNKVFVRPADLERKHREILKDVKQDYVELNAYREFQNHVMLEFKNIQNKIDEGFADIKEALKARRKEDL